MGSDKYPQEHGFIAATSINCARKLAFMLALAMETLPSSRGCLKTSNTFF
jgi:hypothetical protein